MAGYGRCLDCDWFNQPEGCNVERGSKICDLNKRQRSSSVVQEQEFNKV
jgi:hypothetical protein